MTIKCFGLLRSGLLLGLSVSASISFTAVQAGDLGAGKAKAEALCQTCHGVNGIATSAMVANLAGQQKEYLQSQLQAFRSGRRQHAQMSIIAGMLSDDDIDNVSEWYSSVALTVKIPE